MDDHAQQRLARLEQEVAELRQRLDELVTNVRPEPHPTSPSALTSDDVPVRATPPPPNAPPKDAKPSIPQPTDTPPQPGRQRRPATPFNNDAWIGKVGIGLVIIGAIFFFKLAVDSGWITPLMRVIIGTILGLGLIGLGLRLRPEQTLLRQLLPGGGIAILHVTLFAAVVLYGLIAPPVAWIGLLIVSAFGFWNARRIAHPLLAWVALIGGVQGIFTLGLGQGMPTVAYVFINALVALALYVSVTARWPLLAWGAFVFGGGAISFITADDAAGNAIQLLAMAPPIIGSLAVLWKQPILQRGTTRDSEIALGLANFIMPLAAVAWPAQIVHWNPQLVGTAIVIAAGIVALFGKPVLHRSTRPDINKTHQRLTADTFAVPVALLFIVASNIALQGETKLLALIGIAFGMAFIAFKQQWKGLNYFGILIGLIVAATVYDHLLMTGYATIPFLDMSCLVIVTATAAAALLAWQRKEARAAIAYWGVSYIGLLSLVIHQLGGTPGGQALVSLIWSAFGIALFVIGLKHRATKPGITQAGSITLALVVGKLFGIDLAGLSAAVRTVIFLLIGGLFLAVSYISGRAKRGTQ